MTDSNAPQIVTPDGPEPSNNIPACSEQEASRDVGNGPVKPSSDAGPLLGLKPPAPLDVEKAGQNLFASDDPNEQDPRDPLLGAIFSESIVNVGKSSHRRSPQRDCYDLLLRFEANRSDLSSCNSIRKTPRGCYGFSPGLLPKGMHVRAGRYYLRRHVPCDVQPFLKRVEVWRSLRTDSLQVALRRMPSVAAEIETEFERVRVGRGGAVDETLLGPLANDATTFPVTAATDCSIPEVDVPEVTSLGNAYQRYMTDPTHRWSASTRQAYNTSRKLAEAVIGLDVPIGSVTRAHCRDFLEVARHLPRNAAKRYPRLSPREAADRAREQGDSDLVSTANVNAHVANVSSFLNWAVNEELLARNPMRGLRLPDEVAKRDKRHPFSVEQLGMIFDAPIYRGCVDGDRGYAKPGDQRPRNARFWVPLIGLHTGMRLNEICQLDVADVRTVEGVRCFVVSEASPPGGSSDKVLKNSASERLIPLHRNLIGCGLMHYVEQKRRTKSLKLFDDIDPGPRGKRAVAFSKWFAQFSRACGAYQPRTCFHSFRHNFRDELRAADRP